MRTRLLVAFVLAISSHGAPVESVNSFAGDFKRVSVSPSECVDASSCDYLCSAAYTITVQHSTATIYPTANPPACACATLRATIADSTATGTNSGSKFSLTLAPGGVNAISTISGLTCTAKYIASAAAPIDSQVVVNTPAGTTSIISSDATLSTHARPHQLAWVIALSAVIAVYNF